MEVALKPLAVAMSGKLLSRQQKRFLQEARIKLIDRSMSIVVS